MAKSINIEGGTVTIGDWVGFKDDYENSGKLIKINGRELVIEAYDDNTGDDDTFWMDKERCWKDE